MLKTRFHLLFSGLKPVTLIYIKIWGFGLRWTTLHFQGRADKKKRTQRKFYYSFQLDQDKQPNIHETIRAVPFFFGSLFFT